MKKTNKAYRTQPTKATVGKDTFEQDLEQTMKTQEVKKEDQSVQEVMKKRRLLTISETKLGVTMVLSKQDCEKLGIPLNFMTGQAIAQVRTQLGLGVKA
jgi:hypothetical protein